MYGEGREQVKSCTSLKELCKFARLLADEDELRYLSGNLNLIFPLVLPRLVESASFSGAKSSSSVNTTPALTYN